MIMTRSSVLLRPANAHMMARRPRPAVHVSAAAAGPRQHVLRAPGEQQCQQHLQHPAVHIAAAVVSLLLCSSANAATAEANFAVKCAGCHVNGGNIVQAGATLFTADLVKNNVADNNSLYQLIYGGKGRMPGFGQECAPKGKCTFGPRLTDDEVQDLTNYVLDRAAQDWKQ